MTNKLCNLIQCVDVLARSLASFVAATSAMSGSFFMEEFEILDFPCINKSLVYLLQNISLGL